jgi:DNA invertase Pin-like site-specific DNA recombinase
LQHLESLGVQFRSYSEPYFKTENELVSHILLAVMSYFAEYEAKKISSRTKAGLEQARREGKGIASPPSLTGERTNLRRCRRMGVQRRR